MKRLIAENLMEAMSGPPHPLGRSDANTEKFVVSVGGDLAENNRVKFDGTG